MLNSTARNLLIATISFMCFFNTINAQPTWQWGVTMGPNYNSSNSSWQESINNVVSDPDGNYYVLGTTLNIHFVDDSLYTGFSTSANSQHTYLAKFDCSGTMQWVKLMGVASTSKITTPYALIYDEAHNGVFVEVSFAVNASNYIGTGLSQYDTVFTPPYTPGVLKYWVAFRADGSIRWMRPDQKNVYDNSPTFRQTFTVPGEGIFALVHTSTSLPSGPVMPYGTDSLDFQCTYWVKFDEDLNYLWSKKVSEKGKTIPSGWPFIPDDAALSPDGYIYMVGDLRTAGKDSMIIGDSMYLAYPDPTAINSLIAKMDTLGNIKWVKTTYRNSGESFTRIFITKSNEIFVGGGAIRGNTNVYDGYQIVDYGGATISVGLIFKLDTNGELLKGINTDCKVPEIAWLMGSDHTGTLYYYGQLVNDSTTLGGHVLYRKGPPYGLQLRKLNTNLEVIEAHELVCDNNGLQGGNRLSYGQLLVNEQGNVLVTGGVEYGFRLDSTRSVYSHGGKIDNFIAQWGMPCTGNEAAITPVAPTLLQATGVSMNTIDVSWNDHANYEHGFYIYRSATQTGTYTLIDSVPANVTNYSNTGLAAGSLYWYKAAAFNNAGVSDFTNADSARTMDTVIIGLTALNPKQASVQVNPNPFAENATVNCSPDLVGGYLEVYDMAGRRIKSVRITGTTTLLTNQGMNTGSYLYKVTDIHGEVKGRGSIMVR